MFLGDTSDYFSSDNQHFYSKAVDIFKTTNRYIYIYESKFERVV